jgi:hypothetical protein
VNELAEDDAPLPEDVPPASVLLGEVLPPEDEHAVRATKTAISMPVVAVRTIRCVMLFPLPPSVVMDTQTEGSASAYVRPGSMVLGTSLHPRILDPQVRALATSRL